MKHGILPARAARTVTAVAAAIAISVGTASAAAAVTTDYHPTTESRTFATTDGGWTSGTTRSSVLCINGVTCPVVTNSFVATGGADGDGFIRTQSGPTTVASLLNTTTATWTSPDFVYDGAAGATPDSVFFSLARRVTAGSLLAVQLSNPRYRVVLDNVDSSTSRTLVNRLLTNQATWDTIDAVDVDPANLTIGTHYRLRIVTQLPALAVVLTAGTFDYDNVLLRATKNDPVPGDVDGDGVPDTSDNCVNTPNASQVDTDGDSIGDACDATPGDPDTDGDGVPDSEDNCVQEPNANQTDTDHDGIGDACDSTPTVPDVDTDVDGVPDVTDNCDTTKNPNQSDTDKDGIGNACDSTPNGPDTDATASPTPPTTVSTSPTPDSPTRTATASATRATAPPAVPTPAPARARPRRSRSVEPPVRRSQAPTPTT